MSLSDVKLPVVEMRRRRTYAGTPRAGLENAGGACDSTSARLPLPLFPKKPENTRPRRVGPLAPGGSERVRRRRPRSPRSTLFAAPAASATGSRVSGLDEGARDGRASVLWSPLTLRRRLRPSAEEGEANTMAVGDADDICAKYLDGLSWKTVKKAARALSPVIEKIQNSVKLKHFSLADIEPLCPGKVVRDSFLPHNSSSTRRRRRQIVVGDGAGAAPTNSDPNSRQTRAKTDPVGPRWRPENPLLGSAPAGQSKYRHVP